MPAYETDVRHVTMFEARTLFLEYQRERERQGVRFQFHDLEAELMVFKHLIQIQPEMPIQQLVTKHFIITHPDIIIQQMVFKHFIITELEITTRLSDAGLGQIQVIVT